jgi:hypothetical protein
MMDGVPNFILVLAVFGLALCQPALGQKQNATAGPFTVCTLNRPPMVRIRSKEHYHCTALMYQSDRGLES